MIIAGALLWFHIFFAMDEQIKHELLECGINPARITIDLAKVGLIHHKKTAFEYVGMQASYWAEYGQGSVGGTLYKRAGGDDIECSISIYKVVEGTVYIQEHSIHFAHYHLLRLLYQEQERKRLAQEMVNALLSD